MLSSILAWRFKDARVLDSSSSQSQRPKIAGDALDNILCKLPIDVAREILSGYASIADIVRLDSAALVHEHRKLFKLRYKGITVEHTEFVHVCLSSAQWLLNRAVFVRSAKFDCAAVDQWQNNWYPMMREVSKVRIKWSADIERGGVLDGNRLRVLCQHCPKLQDLCIGPCTLETNVLRDVMSMCPLLTEVYIAWSSLHAGNIGPLLTPRIVSLNLMGCLEISDAAVAVITSSCTGLHTLVLDYCKKCTRNSVDSVARNCPQLEVLGLRNLRDLPDASMAALATGCRNLREIYIQFTANLTSVGVVAIASYCTKLTKIALLHCEQVRTNAVAALVSSCPNLRSVDIQADSTMVVALSQHCPNLREANLRWLTYQSNVRVTGGLLAQLLRQCQALTELSVPAFSGSLHFDGAFTSSVEKLCLSWGAHCTDQDTSAVFKFLPKLLEVRLLSFDLVGDQTVLRIAAHCPLLQLVELAELGMLTDASIIALSRACPLLRNICINDCPRLTDRAVVSIAQHCPRLTHLDVCNYCQDTSVVGTALALLRGQFFGDASIAALIAHSKHLRVLDTKGNPRISKSALRALSAALPWCKVNPMDD